MRNSRQHESIKPIISVGNFEQSETRPFQGNDEKLFRHEKPRRSTVADMNLVAKVKAQIALEAKQKSEQEQKDKK